MNPKSRIAARSGAPSPIVSIIALMNELIELMSAEPDMILTRKLEAHRQLLHRKQKLTLDYRAGIKSLASHPELFNRLPEDTRRKLKAASQKLADAADRNARMLRTAVLATQRLIQNIISIVKEEMLPKPGYKNPHTAHLALGTYSPVCKPIAVSRTA